MAASSPEIARWLDLRDEVQAHPEDLAAWTRFLAASRTAIKDGRIMLIPDDGEQGPVVLSGR